MNKEDFKRRIRQIKVSALITGAVLTSAGMVSGCSNAKDSETQNKEQIIMTKDQATENLLQTAKEFFQDDNKDASAELYRKVQETVKNGADVNAQDENGNTALMIILNPKYKNCNADNDNFIQSIRYILEQNPDLTLENNQGVNALDMAKTFRMTSIGGKSTHHTISPQMIAVIRSMQNKYEEQLASGYKSTHQIEYMPAGKTDIKITKENINNVFFETVNAASEWNGAYKSTFDKEKAQSLYNIVKTVIDNGGDINARDENGNTMILSLLEINTLSHVEHKQYSACSSKEYWQTVNYVLDHNPDLTIKNNLGVGVMDYIDFIMTAGEEISPQNVALLRRVSDKYEQQVNPRTNTQNNVQQQTGGKTLSWEKALDIAQSR